MTWYQMLRRHGDWLVLLAALLLGGVGSVPRP